MPEPIRSLEICYRLLRPGGLLSLTTPNLASAGHALFGRDWIGLDAPRHFVLFTPDSLARAAERLGFRISSQPPSCRASWTFTASEAISRGVDPVDHPPALPARLRWNARLADLRALREPRVAEEIVLVAVKPETGPPR